jgi:hypothetical protein
MQFTEFDEEYAHNIPTLVDVMVRDFEEHQTDPFELRAELRKRVRRIPAQQVRRRNDKQAGRRNRRLQPGEEPELARHARSYQALADWTLMYGLLTSLEYREVADVVADRLDNGESLVPSEAELRKYINPSKRSFEQFVKLEPPLWHHLECVAYWISLVQHRFWDRAHAPDQLAGRPNVYQQLVQMKREAAQRMDRDVMYSIIRKEGIWAVTAENIEYYLASHLLRGPDELLSIGGGVQHSFRALVYEYLRHPDPRHPLRSVATHAETSAAWAELHHRNFDKVFGAANWPKITEATTSQYVGLLSPKTFGPHQLRQRAPRKAGRCSAVRGGHLPTPPDRLFQHIGKRYGAAAVPLSITAGDRLNALHLLIAESTGAFNIIEAARRQRAFDVATWSPEIRQVAARTALRFFRQHAAVSSVERALDLSASQLRHVAPGADADWLLASRLARALYESEDVRSRFATFAATAKKDSLRDIATLLGPYGAPGIAEALSTVQPEITIRARQQTGVPQPLLSVD